MLFSESFAVPCRHLCRGLHASRKAWSGSSGATGPSARVWSLAPTTGGDEAKLHAFQKIQKLPKSDNVEDELWCKILAFADQPALSLPLAPRAMKKTQASPLALGSVH